MCVVYHLYGRARSHWCGRAFCDSVWEKLLLISFVCGSCNRRRRRRRRVHWRVPGRRWRRRRRRWRWLRCGTSPADAAVCPHLLSSPYGLLCVRVAAAFVVLCFLLGAALFGLCHCCRPSRHAWCRPSGFSLWPCHILLPVADFCLIRDRSGLAGGGGGYGGGMNAHGHDYRRDVRSLPSMCPGFRQHAAVPRSAADLTR